MSKPGKSSAPFGLTSATCLVVANMIGAGVFTTSGFSLGDIGSRSQVMLAWGIGGVIAICGAIGYGRLVERITESGGEYLFLSRVLHPMVGFVAGWVSLLAGFTGAIAFAATTFEAYAVPQGVRAAWMGPVGSIAVLSIVVFGLLHARVLRQGLITQNVVVAVKLFLLIVFIVYACIVWQTPGWIGTNLPDTGNVFSLYVFASSLVWISLSFSGFNAAVYVAGEVHDARRIVPRALVLGTVVVLAFYLLLNAIFLYAAAPESIAGKPDVAAVAADALGGRWVATLVRLIICLALLSSVSSMIIAGPRVYAQMAKDGVFPSFFKAVTVEGQPRSPQASIWLQVVLASIVVMITTLRDLLAYLGFTLSLSAAGTVACLLVLYAREGKRGVEFWRASIVPLLYVGCTVVLALLAAGNQPWQFAAAVITIASGILAYFVFRLSSAGSTDFVAKNPGR